MSKSNAFENDLLSLLFNATPIANVADNAGTLPLASLYLSLHTADPGEDGDQTTSETAYAGYARAPVARSGAGWVVAGNSVSPAAAINFGECTASPGAAITHAGIGQEASGVGKLFYSGALTPSIAIAVGVAPQVKSTSTIVED